MIDSSKIGFTFWGDMKETIDKYADPVLKYKIYRIFNKLQQ